jgi:hypothetical protein
MSIVIKLLLGAAVAASQTTPGFQFLGFGYDLLHGNPRDTSGFGDSGFRTSIFTFSDTQKQKTSDGKWDIPDKTTSQSMSACSSRQTQTMINSAYSYKRAVETGIDISGNFFGVEFDFSIDTEHVRETTETQKSIFSQIDAMCSAYKLTMFMYDHPPVSSNFLAGVKSLPDSYDEDAYMNFLRDFGTHVVTQMILGGRWGWQSEFKLDDFKLLMDDSVDVSLYLGYAAQVKAGFKLEHNESTQLMTRVTSAISKNSSYSIGGEFKTDLAEWQASVQTKPMPIKSYLMELSELFTESYVPGVDNINTKKANLQKALATYCPYLTKSTGSSVSCSAPQPIPMPTPPPDVKDSIHRVCVRNSGGFAMNFDMYIPSTTHSATSDTFPAGQNRCLDGMMIEADGSDFLTCRIHIVAGVSVECPGKGYRYNPLSTLQSNYECWGSTTLPNCQFRGLSQVGDIALLQAPKSGTVSLLV